MQEKEVTVEFVDGLLTGGVESNGPGEGGFNGYVGRERFERGDGSGHVEKRDRATGSRVKAFEGALGFGLAGVIEDGGVVGKPEGVRDVGDVGSFAIEPFRGDLRRSGLGAGGNGTEKCEENEGTDKKVAGTKHGGLQGGRIVHGKGEAKRL